VIRKVCQDLEDEKNPKDSSISEGSDEPRAGADLQGKSPARTPQIKITRKLTCSTWDVNVPKKAMIWTKNCFAILLLLMV
jgi:hypothetical protein